MRQLLLLLLILVPAAIYLGYVLSTGATAERLKRAPWVWLALAGVALYAAALATWALTGDPAGGEYIPPRLIDGEIVPPTHVPEGGAETGGVPGDVTEEE